MFWIGILPALLVLWIRAKVPESPVWLERQQAPRHHQEERRGVAAADLPPRPAAHHDAVVDPDRQLHVLVLLDLVLVRHASCASAGLSTLRVHRRAQRSAGIAGASLWGRISEGRPGRRGAATIAAVTAIAMVPIYVLTGNTNLLLLGALLMGFFGAGMWGVVPTYLTERFPTAVAQRRRRVRLPRRRRARLAHAVRDRRAARPRLGAAATRWRPASPSSLVIVVGDDLVRSRDARARARRGRRRASARATTRYGAISAELE